MRKGITAFFGMIAGFVLLVIAFLGPWYAINGIGSFGIDGDIDFYLTRMEAKGTLNNQVISISVGYANAKENAQSLGVNIDSFIVIENAMYLSVFALVAALIAVIGIAAFVFRFGTPIIMKYFGGGFAFLTFVLALFPTIYIMNTEFIENMNGFWFSQSVLGVAWTGGPGYAWYLMILVAIIALISSASILVKKMDLKES